MNYTGLSSTEAINLLAKNGKNTLTEAHKTKWYEMLIRQYTELMSAILLIAGVLSFLLDDVEGGAVILFIVALNGVIGFIQEWRTEKTLEALKKMVKPQIRVIRDSKEQMIATEELVIGDIVVLQEGDRIPADGVMKTVNTLKIDEAALTGESLPVDKYADDTVFMGSAVVKGSGILEISSTGMNTKFGEIARLATTTETTLSPLQREVLNIGTFVLKLTGVLCTLLFILEIATGGTFLKSLMFSISVALGAIPEGLQTTLTIALALGAQVLARRNAVMKRLTSVETLGAVSTICSDKTGTLTKNEMTVRELYTASDAYYTVSGVGYNPSLGSVKIETHSDMTNHLELINKACVYCNEAKLVETNGIYTVLGDPTEGALIVLSEKDGMPLVKPYNGNKTVFPFDSDRKMMSVIIDKEQYTKGSPDQILEKCDMTDSDKNKVLEVYHTMANKALRVLAIAYKQYNDSTSLPTNEDDAECHMQFIGLIGMMDPARDDAKDAIHEAHNAGIRVIMITGDGALTARAVASDLGLVYNNNEVIIEGVDIEKMSDIELTNVLSDRSRQVIFARALPIQKRRIVDILQSQGEIVAMTGDGVNDAPALKKADIGIAMGITGTEVSKEAAVMVLEDDSFATIIRAVKEGRRIYENLKKMMFFIFSCNLAELTTIFAAYFMGFPMMLTAILILCIDLGTDILPAVALSVDSAESNVMKRPPRPINKRILERPFIIEFAITGIIIGISVIAVYVYKLYMMGMLNAEHTLHSYIPEAASVGFTTLVLVQLLMMFSNRSFSKPFYTRPIKDNWMLIISPITSLLMVFIMLYTSFLNDILGTYPISINDWILVIIASMVPFIIREIWKHSKNNT